MSCELLLFHAHSLNLRHRGRSWFLWPDGRNVALAASQPCLKPVQSGIVHDIAHDIAGWRKNRRLTTAIGHDSLQPDAPLFAMLQLPHFPHCPF